MRVERNAVATNSRARIEGHESERLGPCRLDHFPSIDTERVTKLRYFVDQSDIDGPERILQQLARLSYARRADLVDLVDDCAVGCHSNFRTRTAHPANHLGYVVRMELRIAWVDALGRESEEVVA